MTLVVTNRRAGKLATKLEYLLERYKELHPEEDDVRPDLVAEWATANNMWVKPAPTPAELLRREISRHLRNSYVTDPQGREVRQMHPLSVEVQTPHGIKRRSRWIGLYGAKPDEILLSAQLRRKAAFADVQQLELDLSSYDDNNIHGAKLPARSYDFDKDLADSQQPTTYQPDTDDDEDDEMI